MRAAVVYESYFGHTRGVAAAIAEGLQSRADIDAVADREHHLAATFDTAVKMTWFPVGSAAKPEAKALAAKGFSIVAPPEHFFVTDKEGPLQPGELDRATAWAQALPTTKPTHA